MQKNSFGEKMFEIKRKRKIKNTPTKLPPNQFKLSHEAPIASDSHVNQTAVC
jgi:hypothetical protein